MLQKQLIPLLVCLIFLGRLGSMSEAKQLVSSLNYLQTPPSDDIPEEYGLNCTDGRQVMTCDKRTQLCTDAVILRCQNCADDVCAFVEGKDPVRTRIQCRKLCPLFWEELRSREFCKACEDKCEVPFTETSTYSSGTEAVSCSEVIAKKDDEIHQLRSQLASRRSVIICLVIFFVVFAAGVTVVLRLRPCCSHLCQRGRCRKTDNCSADTKYTKVQPIVNYPDQERRPSVRNEDDLQVGSSIGSNRTPRAPYYTAKIQQPL